MNIDEYRAKKAEMEMEASQNAQTQSATNDGTQTEQTQTQEAQGKPDETTVPDQTNQVQEQPEEKVDTTETKPEVVEIDGQEFTIEELKQGYLRQNDYTKKTQEVKRKERQVEEAMKFMEELQKNPQIAQQLSQQFEIPNLDPKQAQFTELEDKYYELLVQNELRELTDKYGDFNQTAVLEIARDEGLNNLDTAYHIMQSREGGGANTQEQLDVDALKQQIRDEILGEMKTQKEANVDTSTIIQQTTGTTPIQTNEPKLSQAELKVARAMNLSPEDYVKWRDV